VSFVVDNSVGALPIPIDDQMASHAWSATAQLADLHRLTAYDTAYLELAVRAGLPLATSDKPLAIAARAVGVQVLPTA